jgi:nucleoside-diphosphate-sugar epimerase
MSRSAVVTGATGFIGGRLAARLVQRGWRVNAIVRPRSDTSGIAPGVELRAHDGNAEALEAVLNECRPDVVFHLASAYLASHRPDQVDELVQSNVLFAAQLAEAMTAAGITRLVNTGTAWQHFEGRAYDPVNLYAATKQAGGDVLRYYQNARGLSLVTLKLFDTFGEGDKRRKLAQLLLDSAVGGAPLELSPGLQLLDLTHVDDVVEAFQVAAERLLASGERLDEEFLVSGERMDIRALAGLVERIAGGPLNVEFGARPYREREVMVPVEPGTPPLLPGWERRRSLATWLQARLRDARADHAA